MQTRNKVIIGVVVVAVLGLAGTLSVRSGRDRGIEVRTEAIETRDLVEIVTASGNIRARRTVLPSPRGAALLHRETGRHLAAHPTHHVLQSALL